jgi:hypothetical protein
MKGTSFLLMKRRSWQTLASGLVAVLATAVGAAGNGQAATIDQSVFIAGAPVSVTEASPLVLSVDFGTAFVSIDQIIITSTFDASDSFQISDNYVLVDGDGVGVQRTHPSVTPTLTSVLTVNGGELIDVLLDGRWDFEYRMFQGSVSLASLDFSATGTPVPEPSAAVLVGLGLTGIGLASRRR